MQNNGQTDETRREGEPTRKRLAVRDILRTLWNTVSKNLLLKLISLLLAILLWNYVISTDTSITRPKTLYGITGYVTGQTSLSTYGLALLEDPEQALSNLSVTVEAPQANYARVNSDNVQVSLDLSNIRAAGTQEVRLRATSVYGRVASITPASVTLTFEQLDSRSIPVNCQLVGEGAENMWYNAARMNPSIITVSGAASSVRSITSANVGVDVTDIESPTVMALPYTLVDSVGEEVPQGMLNRSTSSISVTLDAYPSREISISTDPENVLTGKPRAGYEVKSVSIQPETVLIAADADLLDGITELMIEPVSVEGAIQSFSARASLSMLSDIRYASSEQVYVNVTIGQELISAALDDVWVEYTGLSEGYEAEDSGVEVIATGSRDAIEALQEDGLIITVDVTGLSEGDYTLEAQIQTQDYPEVTFETKPLQVTVREVREDG